jgi:hypothetical protein
VCMCITMWDRPEVRGSPGYPSIGRGYTYVYVVYHTT